MKTISMFVSTRTVVGSLLWLLLNILSYSLVLIFWMWVIIINLIQGKNWNGKRLGMWPEVLKIGRHNWILPYHFMVVGMLAFCILNPMLGAWIIFRIFIALAAFECLGIVINYMHKWTDEAGTPLWSSVEYDGENNC